MPSPLPPTPSQSASRPAAAVPPAPAGAPSAFGVLANVYGTYKRGKKIYGYGKAMAEGDERALLEQIVSDVASTSAKAIGGAATAARVSFFLDYYKTHFQVLWMAVEESNAAWGAKSTLLDVQREVEELRRHGERLLVDVPARVPTRPVEAAQAFRHDSSVWCIAHLLLDWCVYADRVSATLRDAVQDVERQSMQRMTGGNVFRTVFNGANRNQAQLLRLDLDRLRTTIGSVRMRGKIYEREITG